MAQVSRTTKQGGNTEFAIEAGSYNPLLSELDADLDAIIVGVNAIDNTQISAGAAIATSKIAADAGLTNASLANTTLTNAKFAVGTTVVASIRDPEPPTTYWSATPGAGAAEKTLKTTSLTTRGGPLFVFVSVSANVGLADNYNLRVKVDGVLLDGFDTMTLGFNIAAGVYHWTLGGLATGLVAGSHAITVTLQALSDTANIVVVWGRTEALELA